MSDEDELNLSEDIVIAEDASDIEIDDELIEE